MKTVKRQNNMHQRYCCPGFQSRSHLYNKFRHPYNSFRMPNPQQSKMASDVRFGTIRNGSDEADADVAVSDSGSFVHQHELVLKDDYGEHETGTLVSGLTEPSLSTAAFSRQRRFGAAGVGNDKSNKDSSFSASSKSTPSSAMKMPFSRQRRRRRRQQETSHQEEGDSSKLTTHHQEYGGVDRGSLCGRQEELEKLENAFDRVCENQTSEVVSIHGVSGVGKSTLVDSLRHSLVVEHDAFFVSGKYDQLGQAAEPYSALVAAFTEICDFYAMPQHQRESALFRERLWHTLRGEVHVLTKLISNLEFLLQSKELCGSDHGNDQKKEEGDDSSLLKRDTTQPQLLGSDSFNAERLPGNKSDTAKINTRDNFMTMSQAFVRFKQICTIFLRLAATEEHPILLFLDDIQWADEPSLDVIEALMADRQSKHLLLVMTYRDDDNMGTLVANQLGLAVQPQRRQRRHANPASSQQRLARTDILLQNLDLEGVKEVVEQLFFSSSGYSADELADVLLQKTEGNFFFLLKLLDRLQEEGLLKCGVDGWEWDVARIQAETDVADNVVELIFGRLHKLETDIVQALQMASFLGYHFDRSVLIAVAAAEEERVQQRELNSLALSAPWTRVEPTDEQQEWLDQVLLVAIEENLIEPTSFDGRYKFSHDRVQQCLYELTPEGDERRMMHFRIGLVIWRALTNGCGGHTDGSHDDILGTYQPDDRFLFLAADHILQCCHSVVHHDDRLELARLFHRTGKLATAKAAFSSAREYVMTGISLLDADAQWGEETYDLTLDLHSTLAEILNSSGSFSQSQTVSEEVLRNAKGLSDKTRCYWSLATALGSQGKVMQSAEVSFDFLRQLGEHFPKRPTQAHVAMEMLRTLQVVARKSDEAILNLPLMTDEKKIAAMNILGNISLNVYLHFAAKNIFVMVGLRMMRLSCVHGLTNMSTFGVANFAMVLSVFGFHDRACRFGELALKLSERLSARDTLARTLAILNHFVMHWRHPLVEGIAAFERTYLLGMETGDIEFAFAGAVGHISFMFYASPNVAFVQQEATDVINLLEDFQHKLTGWLAKPCSQIALNLMGCADDPAILTGDAMNEDEMEQVIQAHDNIAMAYFLDLMKLQAAFFFESYPRMRQYLKKVDRFMLSIRGNFIQYTSLFMIGLCNYCLYRKFGKRKYKARGRRICRVLKRFTTQGCDNANPFYLLLDAERLSLLGDKDAAIGAYELAFADGQRNASMCYEAMSYERAGIALAPTSPEVGRDYMANAVHLWKSWGAVGKAEMLERQYHSMIRYGRTNTPRMENFELSQVP